MNILLDVIIVALVLIIIIEAIARGFTVVFLRSIGRLVVLVAAWFVSRTVSDWFFTSFLRQPLVDRVGMELSTSIAGGIDRSVSKALAAMPDFLVSGMKSIGLTPDTITPQVESAVSGQGESIASAFVDTAVAPVALLLLRVLLFLIFFVIGMILLKVITHGASMIVNLPLIRQADMVFGAVIGIVNAAIVVFFIVAITAFLIPMCGDSLPLLNTETIEHSQIFKFLYHLNPITAVAPTP